MVADCHKLCASLVPVLVQTAELGAQHTLEVAKPYLRGAMHTKPCLEERVCCAVVPAHPQGDFLSAPGVKPFRHHCPFLSPTISALWICFPWSRSLRPRRIQSRNMWFSVRFSLPFPSSKPAHMPFLALRQVCGLFLN